MNGVVVVEGKGNKAKSPVSRVYVLVGEVRLVYRQANLKVKDKKGGKK